ncbi:PRD domain-containing protein [Geosporobacter ferrireducens]|uniref:PRD domain-containing protein n=1 Tax=Geosporobacter ferrireducens TaxID=1424294 RepID=A0A1D8GHH0_9FIRM|nr:PRD domain-containing protein [Geosporobacter ferrireducens]AOT70363.1 hypothetical protein Gferi_12635 [Geosporobacter ferrireducens]MTI54336.1 PRD domain-containing protein [Geosporobacter ferrireducens]
MDDLLKQRLDILEESDQISPEIKIAVIDFAQEFEKKYALILTEENGSMLITHLAIALTRIKNGEEINAIDELVLDEVKQSKLYDELPKFYKRLEEQLSIKIPDSEKGFIAAHACTILSKLQNEGGEKGD